MNTARINFLLVTDIPAPWREKVYEKVYRHFGNQFHVVYCNNNEKRRLWKFPLGNHPKTLLKTIMITSESKGLKENYLNFGIIPFLLKHRPRVVVCFSLVPTIFIAVVLSKLIGAKVVVFADTWLGRDTGLSSLQKLARRFVYGIIPDSYLGASKQTLNMYRFYNKNVRDSELFLSHLCADNDYFVSSLNGGEIVKTYDLMFSGRIVNAKNPLFFADVAGQVKKRLGRCKVLIIGDGDETAKSAMFESLEGNGVEYDFPGFIEHADLPQYYSKSRVLLLPTSGDCWGVVINEAMVSGVPVVTTNMTAAAGELVMDGINGYVLPLDVSIWTDRIVALLGDRDKLQRFTGAARETVAGFNFDKAAEGIVAAIEHVAPKEKRNG